jgi:hypothetical protein
MYTAKATPAAQTPAARTRLKWLERECTVFGFEVAI